MHPSCTGRNEQNKEVRIKKKDFYFISICWKSRVRITIDKFLSVLPSSHRLNSSCLLEIRVKGNRKFKEENLDDWLFIYCHHEEIIRTELFCKIRFHRFLNLCWGRRKVKKRVERKFWQKGQIDERLFIYAFLLQNNDRIFFFCVLEKSKRKNRHCSKIEFTWLFIYCYSKVANKSKKYKKYWRMLQI